MLAVSTLLLCWLVRAGVVLFAPGSPARLVARSITGVRSVRLSSWRVTWLLMRGVRTRTSRSRRTPCLRWTPFGLMNGLTMGIGVRRKRQLPPAGSLCSAYLLVRFRARSGRRILVRCVRLRVALDRWLRRLVPLRSTREGALLWGRLLRNRLQGRSGHRVRRLWGRPAKGWRRRRVPSCLPAFRCGGGRCVPGRATLGIGAVSYGHSARTVSSGAGRTVSRGTSASTSYPCVTSLLRR